MAADISSAKVLFNPAWTLPGERVLVTDKAGVATTLDITTKHLRHLVDVTGDIQAQIDKKQGSGAYLTGLVGDVISEGPGAGGAVIAPRSITNEKIRDDAQIAYSKLNLAGKIQGTDLSDSVKIPYSKLDLNQQIKASDIGGILTASQIDQSGINWVGKIHQGEWAANVIPTEFGGTGANLSSSVGVVKCKAGLMSAYSVLDEDVAGDANISRSKIRGGAPNRIVINGAHGELSEADELSRGKLIGISESGLLQSCEALSVSDDSLKLPPSFGISFGGVSIRTDDSSLWISTDKPLVHFHREGVTIQTGLIATEDFSTPAREETGSESPLEGVSFEGKSFVRISAKDSIVVNTVLRGTDGKRVVVANATGSPLTFTHKYAKAKGANRPILCPGETNFIIPVCGSAEVIFDLVENAWRVIK